MPDDRPLREKLLAMANQTASPHEAEIAREALERLDAAAGPRKTPGVLTRDDILGSPESETAGRTLRFYSRSAKMWITVDPDEAELLNFDLG